MIPYIVGASMSVVLGLLEKKILVNRRLAILLSTVVYFGTHCALLYAVCEDACYTALIPLILLGFSFSLFTSVIMSSVPLTVEMNVIGTAFGLMGVFQNFALSLFPMITGVIYEISGEDEFASFGA